MEPQVAARSLMAEIRALPDRSTAPVRRVRQRWSRTLKAAPGAEVRATADAVIFGGGPGWVGYELIAAHAGAFATLAEADIEAMAEGLADWGAIDAFGTILVGPAWRAGAVSDAAVMAWAASPDRWRRRLALVATVKRQDAGRTLAVCEALVADRDDMVVKALSWALRELSKSDRAAVETFLDRHEEAIAARVRREVGHKLATGLKSGRRDPS